MLLKVDKNSKGKWKCGEVFMNTPLGYGTYTFEVVGPNVALLDPYYVLGLFSYHNDTQEIDLEFSRRGKTSLTAKNANFANQPSSIPENLMLYAMPAAVTAYRVSYTWTAGSIVFFAKSTAGPTWKKGWTRTGPSVPTSDVPLLVHMNLWLFQGHIPSQPATVKVKSFRFTPQH
jgi:hypothetical protein